MPAPLAQGSEEDFDRLVVRPRVLVKDADVDGRLPLLHDDLVNRWMGVKIMSGIVGF